MASAAFEEIVEDFEFLDDWEDRYRHVIDMGKAMEDWTPHLRWTRTKCMAAHHKYGCSFIRRMVRFVLTGTATR